MVLKKKVSIYGLKKKKFDVQSVSIILYYHEQRWKKPETI